MNIWLDEEDIKLLNEDIHRFKPTDVIILTEEQKAKIGEVYTNYFKSLDETRQNIIKARLLERLPFYNFSIKMKDVIEPNIFSKDRFTQIHELTIDVILLEDTLEKAFKEGESNTIPVGIIQFSDFHYSDNKKFVPELQSSYSVLYLNPIHENNDKLYVINTSSEFGSSKGVWGTREGRARYNNNDFLYQHLQEGIWNSLDIVLAILFAFQNPPEVESIFIGNKVDEKRMAKEYRIGKKKPLKYVRHVINDKSLDEYVSSKGKEFIRYTNVWGVIGHVRHYKNGKTVYIKPYEKGKDRNKGLLTEPRERIVDDIKVREDS